jgi:hypothetical protein
LLALGLGWLARPEDEYAGLRALHPREEVIIDQFARGLPPSTRRVFSFTVPSERVVAIVKSFPQSPFTGAHGSWSGWDFPSGNSMGMIIDERPSPGKETCWVTVFENPPGPWYQVAWQSLKRRLGI